jgi:hypothetical protein
MFHRRSPFFPKTQLQSSIKSIQDQLSKKVKDGAKAFEDKMFEAIAKNQPEPEFNLDRKELEIFFKDVDSVIESFPDILMIAGNELGMPLKYRNIVKAVKKAVSEQKKSKDYLIRFVEGFQKNIRKEDDQILLVRFSNCGFTKAILEDAQLDVRKENFLKVAITISKLFKVPYIIPEEFSGNFGYLPPSLFWETQREPLAHGSLVAAHLSGWASSLQLSRVTEFKVTNVHADFVILIKLG